MVVKILTGNYAAAEAAKLARVQVVAAYPITPQTQVVEKLAEYIEKGELAAEMIRVESEHSAMAACIGAAAAGARVFTATSAQGLLYMYEMLWWAAGARLPVVMGVVTRALAPPWSIWTEHADILSPRDSGWIIMFAENAQEVLDMIIQAFRIAEDPEILLPVMVGWDAFTTSHTAEPVDVPDQEVVDKFLPPRDPTKPFLLDPENPFSHGSLVFPDHYMEFRYLINKACEKAAAKLEAVDKEYGEKIGRRYGGLVECYRCDDADYVIVTIGSMAGDAKEAIDILRSRGVKAGLCRIRVIRPSPCTRLAEILSEAKGVIFVERDVSMGLGGILATELAAEFYKRGYDIKMASFVAGLGGREVSVEDFLELYEYSVRKFELGERFLGPLWHDVKKEVVEG